MIRAEDLQDAESALLLDNDPKANAAKGKYVQRYRDVMKRFVMKSDGHCNYLLLGIEAQTNTHYAMPVRDMLYDAMQYAMQVEQLKAYHRENGEAVTSDEFLSGMKKEDKLKPVITLVVFFSTHPWEGPKKLSDMLEIGDPKWKHYIQDYKIHLIQPANMTSAKLNMLHTDLREVMEFLKYAGNRKKMNRIMANDDRYKCMDQKAVNVVSSCANIEIKIDNETEDVNMCKAWEDQKEVGVKEGEVKGRREGKIEGRYEQAIISCKDFGLGVKETIEYLQKKFTLSAVDAEATYRKYAQP